MQTGTITPSTWKINRRWLLAFITLLFIFVALLLAGCTTTPQQVHTSQASFDGNEQNSGLIGFDAANGSAYITSHANDRYTNLLATFGKRLEFPPKAPEDGLNVTFYMGPDTNYFGKQVWVIDAQHLNYFKAMNRWRKETAPH